MKAPQLTGVVLAGGRSRRMRRNKATLPLNGQPLWQRQAKVLRAAGCSPVLFALRPRQRSLGHRAMEIRDVVEHAGPLAGLHAALAAASSPLVAVLAVDMPRVTTGWFRRLRGSCTSRRGAVFRGPEGVEPLAAVYPRAAALVEATRRIRRSDLAVHRLVAALVRAGHLKVLRLTARELPQAVNWNRPKDVAGRR